MKMVRLEPIKRSTLSVDEIAVYIGVSIDMIYKMTREKAIPHFRVGRRILFRKDAIDKWINEQMGQIYEGQ